MMPVSLVVRKTMLFAVCADAGARHPKFTAIAARNNASAAPQRLSQCAKYSLIRVSCVAPDKEQTSPGFFAAEEKPAEGDERDFAEKRLKFKSLIRGGGADSFLYSFWKYRWKHG